MDSKYIYRSILLFSIFLIVNSLYSQKLKFKYLTPDEGLSSSSVTSILQDNKGFIWIGTYDGLNRYDGFEFVVYKYAAEDSSSLSHNLVWCLHEDKQNNLFIGTTVSLCRFDWRTDTFINYMENNSSPLNGLLCAVRSIKSDSLDNLWLATDIGVIYFDRINNTIVQYQHDINDSESLSHNNVEDIHLDNQNNLWISTRKGLNFLGANTTTFKLMKFDSNNNDLSNTFFLDIVQDKQGNLWFGSYDGLYKLNIGNNEKNRLINYRHNSKDKSSLSNNRVLSILADDRDQLWAGTENGLNLYNKKDDNFIHFTTDVYNPHSLNNESIHSLYQDKTGSLWVGTFAGGVNVSNRNSEAILHYQNIPGASKSLSHNSVTNFIEDKSGKIWIGTDGGGLNLFEKEKERFIHFNPQNSNLKSDAIISAIEDSQNQIWLGTWAGGLSQFNKSNGSFKSFNTENSGLLDNNIFSVMEDKNGLLWLGSFQHGLIKFNRKNSTFSHYTPENSNISTSMVVDIKETSNGTLLVCTPVGFNIFNPENEHFTVYLADVENPKSISSNSIHQALIENDTTIWLATLHGLNRFNPTNNQFTIYDTENGLPDDNIQAIAIDKSGKIWVTTNKGLCRFDYKNNKTEKFTKADGLQSNEFNAKSIMVTSNGSVYAGGRKGFNIIYPDKIVKNDKVPNVLFTDFRIFNKHIKIGADKSPLKQHISETKEIILSNDQSVLSFSFAVMDFTIPEKNQYAYMMEGFETDWNYVNNQHTANYTSLDPGEYIFRVKGSNNDGIWNEEGASIKITILPPWWELFWFRALIVVLVFILIFTVYKIRTFNLNRWNRILTEKNLELQKSEEKYRSIFEQFIDIYYQIDMNGVIKIVSPSVKPLTGYDPEELLGKPALTVYDDPSDRDGFLKELHKSGYVHDYELNLKNKTGERVAVSINAHILVNDDGSPYAIEGVMHNITERKQFEAEVLKLSQSVEQSPALVVITDLQGNIEYVNPKFTEVTGYSFEEIKGKNTRFLKSGKTSEEEYGNLWKTIKEGKEWRSEIQNKKKNGELYWESIIISPIKNDKDEMTHYLAVKEDITEFKQLQHQFLQSQRVESIGILAGGIAHDFNNLLTIINGYVDISLLKLDKDHPAYQDILPIKQAGERAENLTRQLLAFSRKQVYTPKILNINRVINDLDKMVHRLIGEDIDVEKCLESDINPIKADPGQIEQILINLIVNAKDAINTHTEKSSEKKITIETNNIYLDGSYVSEHVGSQVGPHVKISISDTGSGMDENTIDKVFEPFFTTKEEGKGTGLGLSTVYGIVKQNHGSIFIYSELCVGTTIKIYWPSFRQEFQSKIENQDEINTYLGKETILVVEDNKGVRNLALTSLQKFGYTTYGAANGEEALHVLEKMDFHIDIIISDVVMPKMGGKELFEKLKEMNKKVPFIFASGYTDNHIVHNSQLIEGFNFLQKPYSIDTLAKRVREVLDKKGGDK